MESLKEPLAGSPGHHNSGSEPGQNCPFLRTCAPSNYNLLWRMNYLDLNDLNMPIKP